MLAIASDASSRTGAYTFKGNTSMLSVVAPGYKSYSCLNGEQGLLLYFFAASKEYVSCVTAVSKCEPAVPRTTASSALNVALCAMQHQVLRDRLLAHMYPNEVFYRPF
jgi:hypothetical protein